MDVVEGFPNNYLVNVVVHENIVRMCFCNGCKERRFNTARNINYRELKEQFMRTLPFQENRDLDMLFESAINKIVIGKAFKESSLENTGYKYFKSWAKHEPVLMNLSPKQFSNFCEQVNEASSVFDHWDVIVRNLTDKRMEEIDARRFSVRQFFLAKSIDWCLNYNEILRKKMNKREDPLYSEDRYAEIIQNIFSSGILDEIDHNPQVASRIGHRLQSDMVAYCRRRYQPY